LVGLLLFNGTFSTNRLYDIVPKKCNVCHAGQENNTSVQLNSETIV